MEESQKQGDSWKQQQQQQSIIMQKTETKKLHHKKRQKSDCKQRKPPSTMFFNLVSSIFWSFLLPFCNCYCTFIERRESARVGADRNEVLFLSTTTIFDDNESRDHSKSFHLSNWPIHFSHHFNHQCILLIIIIIFFCLNSSALIFTIFLGSPFNKRTDHRIILRYGNIYFHLQQLLMAQVD